MNPSIDEASLLNLLRAGDEAAFTHLVEQFHPSLLRLARLFVHDETIAEELAQETWLAVLQGLNHFEGRSSLKTWIFTILTNKAKTRGQRERRTISFTNLEDELHASSQPTVDPERFNTSPVPGDFNHWVWPTRPASWEDLPEESLLSQETMHLISQVIHDLPENQRIVITLRDIQEFSSDEICNVLGISETNQRVLLHRARAKVRQALEEYLQQKA
jgi:RNA polymerase sigma-70 factor (ECF subfamily)